MKLCECGCGHATAISTRSRPDRAQAKGEPSRFVRGHALRGKSLSLETRQKMSAARKGRRHTAETKALLSAARPHGPNHPDWKGDDVAYSTLHRWISRVAVKTGTCSLCGAERITEWANLSGEYRRDISDFAEMCVPCHKHYDNARRVAA